MTRNKKLNLFESRNANREVVEFNTQEEKEEYMAQLDAEGTKYTTSNRAPLKVFIGTSQKSRSNVGPFAADVIAFLKDDSVKVYFDKLVEEKGGVVEDEYTIEAIADLFSRVELKKLAKQLPDLAKVDAGGENTISITPAIAEFKKIYGEDVEPFDVISADYKKGTPICPIAKVFIDKGFIKFKELIYLFNANGDNDAVEQLNACKGIKSVNESTKEVDALKLLKLTNPNNTTLNAALDIAITELDPIDKVFNEPEPDFIDFLNTDTDFAMEEPEPEVEVEKPYVLPEPIANREGTKVEDEPSGEGFDDVIVGHIGEKDTTSLSSYVKKVYMLDKLTDKKAVAFEMLQQLKGKHPNLNKQIKLATKPEDIDKLVTNISLSDEGLSTVK